MKPSYSKHGPGSQILCIDWETSGSTFSSYEETFKQYQGIAFGAIVANATTFEPVKTMYREIKFDCKKYKWSKEAEAIHGLSREHLDQNGITQEEAAADLAEFILESFGTGKVMLLGHNPHFDIEATVQLLQPHGVMPELFHVVLDTSAAGYITIGKYKSDDVFEFFTGKNREGCHNALDDALMALETVRNMRALMDSALGK